MIRIIILFFFLIALSVPAIAKDERGIAIKPIAPTGEKAKGDQWVLTIGIDSYLSWPRLKTATNDAKALKKVLLDRYHVEPSHVIELYDENATRENILGSLRDLTRKIKPEDSLLIYYAGHGHVDNITKRGSWIPVESRTDNPSAWISNQEIKDYLNIDAIKAKHVLLVSDSCFSGDFFRGTRGAIPEVTDTVIRKAYGLSSRQAITSGGLEPVSDAGFGGNSVFSHFLVAALKNNTNPYLIPSELFPSIKSGVAQNAEQFPQLGSLYGVGGQDGGELVLFLKQEDRLGELSAGSTARQKELDLLKKAEAEAAIAKQKEQAEIAKKQAELDALDKQIAEMKLRLGSGLARSNDGLDTLVSMVEQKEQQAQKLDELRQKREAEEIINKIKVEKLRNEANSKLYAQIMGDIAKYKKVAFSKFGGEIKDAAWDALVANYPEAIEVVRHDLDAFSSSLKLNILTSTIIDRKTGLMWSRCANIAGEMRWPQAIDWVKNLEYGGYKDWRLPSIDELKEFVKLGGNNPIEYLKSLGFTNISDNYYWSSSDSTLNSYSQFHWIMRMYFGSVSDSSSTSNYNLVWPVRDVR